MATMTAYAGGGRYAHIQGGMPLMEADDTWADKLAAKAFVLGQATTDARAYGCAWVQVRQCDGRAVTARKSIDDA